MAKLQANGSGVVSGAFQIPAGVLAGAKKVALLGNGGSYGETTFTGRGQLTVDQRRRVITIDQYHVDPLAQTFSLSQGRHVAAADLWFTAKGAADKPVYVQIRGVQNGVPTGEVLAQGIIPASAINLGGAETRVTWEPVWLEANREYALVALTDDAEHALAIAELGKFAVGSGWITEQPYQIGVLLSSSNASTWTPHQDRDLAFRLYGAKFNALTRTVALGSINAANATDLIAAATVERPSADTNVEFIFLPPSGVPIRVSPGQVVALPAKLTGNVAVSAVLSGSALRSPVLYPGVQAIVGQLTETADYYTRAVPCGEGAKVTVYLETLTPGTSTISVSAQKDDDTYEAVPLLGATPVGDGWEERKFVLTPFTATNTRIKLLLTGTALYRPEARKLRVVIT